MKAGLPKRREERGAQSKMKIGLVGADRRTGALRYPWLVGYSQRRRDERGVQSRMKLIAALADA
jgi:hypothetical protein